MKGTEKRGKDCFGTEKADGERFALENPNPQRSDPSRRPPMSFPLLSFLFFLPLLFDSCLNFRAGFSSVTLFLNALLRSKGQPNTKMVRGKWQSTVPFIQYDLEFYPPKLGLYLEISRPL